MKSTRWWRPFAGTSNRREFREHYTEIDIRKTFIIDNRTLRCDELFGVIVRVTGQPPFLDDYGVMFVNNKEAKFLVALPNQPLRRQVLELTLGEGNWQVVAVARTQGYGHEYLIPRKYITYLQAKCSGAAENHPFWL